MGLNIKFAQNRVPDDAAGWSRALRDVPVLPSEKSVTPDKLADATIDFIGNKAQTAAASEANAAITAHVVAADPHPQYISPTEVAPTLWPRTAAEIAAAVSPVDYGYSPYNVLRYRADPAGNDPSDSAFNDAIAAATKEGNAAVIVPQGKYLITSTITIHQGVPIIGQSMGSTLDYGCCILHTGTGDCFKWDGNGLSAKGTGGGLRDMLIVKQTGVSGGYAINLIATDDNHRPTEFWFQNILIYASGTGQWARAFNIDGTACNTPGGKGVRDIAIFKLRVAGCSENNKYINISQGVHVHGSYIEVDTGNGTGTPGMTINGESGPICLTALEINGTVEINDTSSKVNLQGHISTLDVNNASASGSFIGSASTITNASQVFRIVSPVASAFEAVRSSDVLNVTGDGTVYTVPFNTEKYDTGLNYDPATGIFTCTQAGLYLFRTRITFRDLTASFTSAQVRLDHKNSGGTLQGRAYALHNPASSFVTISAVGYYTMEVVEQFKLSETDTVRCDVVVSGGTLAVGIEGSDFISTFSGKLLA